MKLKPSSRGLFILSTRFSFSLRFKLFTVLAADGVTVHTHELSMNPVRDKAGVVQGTTCPPSTLHTSQQGLYPGAPPLIRTQAQPGTPSAQHPHWHACLCPHRGLSRCAAACRGALACVKRIWTRCPSETGSWGYCEMERAPKKLLRTLVCRHLWRQCRLTWNLVHGW